MRVCWVPGSNGNNTNSASIWIEIEIEMDLRLNLAIGIVNFIKHSKWQCWWLHTQKAINLNFHKCSNFQMLKLQGIRQQFKCILLHLNTHWIYFQHHIGNAFADCKMGCPVVRGTSGEQMGRKFCVFSVRKG